MKRIESADRDRIEVHCQLTLRPQEQTPGALFSSAARVADARCRLGLSAPPKSDPRTRSHTSSESVFRPSGREARLMHLFRQPPAGRRLDLQSGRQICPRIEDQHRRRIKDAASRSEHSFLSRPTAPPREKRAAADLALRSARTGRPSCEGATKFADSPFDAGSTFRPSIPPSGRSWRPMKVLPTPPAERVHWKGARSIECHVSARTCSPSTIVGTSSFSSSVSSNRRDRGAYSRRERERG